MKLGRTSDRVNLPDQATVLLFLEHFCEHNRSSNVYNGTVALLQSRRRSGFESTQAMIVGRMRVRTTLRRLNDCGFGRPALGFRRPPWRIPGERRRMAVIRRPGGLAISPYPQLLAFTERRASWHDLTLFWNSVSRAVAGVRFKLWREVRSSVSEISSRCASSLRILSIATSWALRT